MPTLSLCLICRNDEAVIGRLLESIKGPLFDEIIVVDTGSTDKTIEIAKKYTDKIFHFKWVDDFSAARNFSFSKATSTFQMWLDTDDIIRPVDYQKLLDLKPKLDISDVWLLKYEYAHDEFDNSICSLWRERILRRSLNPQWVDPIHEFIPLSGKIERANIEIHHYKIKNTSSRNIPMLEKLVAKNPKNARNIFYLGKEYFDNNDLENAFKTLHKFVKMPEAWSENKYAAHMRLAKCYLDKANKDETYNQYIEALKAYPYKAEVYCELGDLALSQKDYNKAIHWYKIAANIGISEVILDIIEPKYYTWYPNLQLCVCYNALGKVFEAAECNEKALEHFPQNFVMQSNKKIFKEYLKDKYPIKKSEVKQGKKIGWLVPEAIEAGTIRIRTLNINKYLKIAGHHSDICTYDTAKLFDVIIVGKSFSLRDLDIIQQLKKQNKTVIADLSEDILDYHLVDQILQACDLVVCCSKELANKTKTVNSNTIIIEDAVEYSNSIYVENKNELLNVYWFGYGGSSWMAEKMRYMIQNELGMRLITIHEHPDANIKWDLNTVYQNLEKADIIIVPANYKVQPCKSNNRVTQAMAITKPVIASPLPAYLDVIKQGINGYICNTDTELEWKEFLSNLKNNPDLRKSIAQKGYETSRKFSLENIANQWLKIIENPPKIRNIDVIIPTRNNVEILKECLDSFKNSTFNEEIYLIDNGNSDDTNRLINTYNVPLEVIHL